MKKNCTLFIDTTNNYCYLAVFCNNKILKEAKLPVNKNVTDIIVPNINTILIEAKVKFSQITHMCVNIGPGSFTGDKVGIIIAKAWKLFASKIQILTINSLLLQTTKAKPSCISVIDAKSNKLYLAVYKNGKEIVKPKLINASALSTYKNKYKLPVVSNQTDHMYKNFSIHAKSCKKIQDIKYLEPLYLKNPV